MADITDPQAIKFVNEDMRPLAEEIRALNARILDVENRWFGQSLNITITNDAGDNIVDGRQSNGVSQLTGADVHNLMAVLVNISNQMDASGQLIEKHTVRSLRVS